MGHVNKKSVYEVMPIDKALIFCSVMSLFESRLLQVGAKKLHHLGRIR